MYVCFGRSFPIYETNYQLQRKYVCDGVCVLHRTTGSSGVHDFFVTIPHYIERFRVPPVRVFERKPEQSYNIINLCRAAFREALPVVQIAVQMTLKGLKPTPVIFSSIVDPTLC